MTSWGQGGVLEGSKQGVPSGLPFLPAGPRPVPHCSLYPSLCPTPLHSHITPSGLGMCTLLMALPSGGWTQGGLLCAPGRGSRWGIRNTGSWVSGLQSRTMCALHPRHLCTQRVTGQEIQVAMGQPVTDGEEGGEVRGDGQGTASQTEGLPGGRHSDVCPCPPWQE